MKFARRFPALGFASLALLATVLSSCDKCRRGDATPSGSSASTVRVVFDDGAPYARPGLAAFVDDEPAGVTDANGELRIAIPAGAHSLRVVDPGFSTAVVDVTVGQQPEVFEVMMVGDTDRPAEVTCPQATAGFLPESATAFELRVRSVPTGKPIDIAEFTVGIVDAADTDPANVDDVSSLFAAGTAAGQIVVVDAAAFFAAADYIANAVRIVVSGHDNDGATFEQWVDVFVGRHALDLSLAAPPSAPSLEVVGVTVSARLIGTEIVRDGVTDGFGRVRFESLPAGTYELSATTSVGATVYSAIVAQFVDGDILLGLRLLAVEDVLNGVLPTTVYQDAGFVTHPRPAGAGRGTAISTSAIGGNSISVSSQAQNQTVSNSTTFLAPIASSKVKLTFEVVSVEYPEYVLAASQYNDNWTLRVLGPNGEHLDGYVRNVNSQVAVSPTWIPGTFPGRTGEIVKEIDVSAFTANQPAALTLVITSTNIGDDLLPTSVTASLQSAGFEIASIEASNVTPDYSCSSHTKKQTVQDQFSIPYANEVNRSQRSLYVRLAGLSPSAQVTRVQVDLIVAGASQALATVADAAPSLSGRVRPVGAAGDRFEALVTFEPSLQSPVAAAVSPPADKIEYAVTVEAIDGFTSLTAQRRSQAYGALWKAEVGARTGCEEPGGDQWAAQATIDWLGANRSLLDAINDISGEHDRNIGHDSHNAGRAVDFRQYTTAEFASASGLGIYIKLAKAMQDAVSGDTVATARLANWFSLNRTRMEPLIDLPSVRSLLVADSKLLKRKDGTIIGAGLPDGWFHGLLTQGSVAAGATTIDLGIGIWTTPNVFKVKPMDGHLDHYHVALDL